MTWLCCRAHPSLRHEILLLTEWIKIQNCTIKRKCKTLFNKNLPDGELNPGLPRDRRGYLPLYYRGYVRAWTIFVANNQLLFHTPRHSTIYIISCFMCDINELYTMMWLFYMMYDIRTVEY